MTTASRRATATWLAIVVAMAAGAAAAGDAPPLSSGLVASSSADQLWVVVPTPDQPPRFRLLHHAEGMNGPYFRVADEYAEAPEALAAWNDAVWVVFPPGSAAGGRRSVLGFRARRNPALGTYYNDPPGHPELLDSLPGDSHLRGAVGTPDGPVVLFSVAPPVTRDRVQFVEPRPSLLAWHGGGWRELPVPEQAGGGSDALIGAVAGDRTGLILLTRGTGGWLLHARLDEGPWTSWPAPASEARPMALAAIGDRPFVVESSDDRLRLAYLRERGPLAFATAERPAGRWIATGLGADAVLVEFTNLHVLRWKSIDGTTGTAGDWVELQPDRPESERWLHVPLLGVMVVGAVMLLLMFRGDAVAEPPLESPTVQPMPLSARTAALLLDYLPAAAVTLLLTRCDPLNLVVLPIWTVRVEVAAPPLLALALTCLHSGLAEAIVGASLGKWVVGASVRRVDGSRAGVFRCLARSVLKFLVLAMPVVGVFCLMNVNHRGLPELGTGTIVVRSMRRAPATG